MCAAPSCWNSSASSRPGRARYRQTGRTRKPASCCGLDVAGFQYAERGDDERRAMVEKHRDRLLHGGRPIQDGTRDPVGGSIQLVVSERMPCGPDGDSARIFGDLLFETIADGLVDLCLLELDECARRMEAAVPDGALLWREVRDSVGGVIHSIAVTRGSTGNRAVYGARGAAGRQRRRTNGKGRDQIARST